MQPFGKPSEHSAWTMMGKRTIYDILLDAVNSHPHKPAIVQAESDVRLTYAQFHERVRALATGLRRMGLRAGDRVVACLPNWPEFAIILFACAQSGLILVPVNPRLRQQEIEFVVNNADPRAAVIGDEHEDAQHYGLFVRAQQVHPELEHLITVGPAGQDLSVGTPFSTVLELGRMFENAVNKAGAASDSADTCPGTASAPVDAEDIAAIVYTSGTTGTPKGAMLSHRNLLFSGDRMNEALENGERDVVLIVVPVCHVFGLAVTIMTVATRSTMVLMNEFHPETVFQVIEREHVTVHHGVSTMFVLELNHPSRPQYNLSSLRTGIVAATPCPYEVVERIRAELGLSPILSYGMTECSPALTASHFETEAWVYATVGRVLPGVELRVVDEAGRVLPTGEVGELVVKSPGLMRGYYRNEEATRQAIDAEGWFHTGDLGHLDEQGYVTVVGRIKEMINRAGLKIYPREVEDVLYEHPAVQEAALVPVPDPVLGERSCACVTVKPGCQLSAEDVREFCRERLADYKVPDIVEILPELPLNSSKKIYKLELARMMREKHPPVFRKQA
ncbi:class I adenylate-forming enzyme family protein [Alicyclobacillus kakegawensis]|uniref:class I adenylate-forming enzyme family protein n=1 Tax=Alicyclobacillus kakegawensis TaxID=392012 RepID=UPI000833C1F2|nr:AMP-binding protein [Alicyclobacillus kakegawensis]